MSRRKMFNNALWSTIWCILVYEWIYLVYSNCFIYSFTSERQRRLGEQNESITSHLRSIDKTTFAWWIVQFYCLTYILGYFGSLEPLNGSFHSNPLDILLENLSKSEVVGLKGPVVGLSPLGPTLVTPLVTMSQLSVKFE